MADPDRGRREDDTRPTPRWDAASEPDVVPLAVRPPVPPVPGPRYDAFPAPAGSPVGTVAGAPSAERAWDDGPWDEHWDELSADDGSWDDPSSDGGSRNRGSWEDDEGEAPPARG